MGDITIRCVNEPWTHSIKVAVGEMNERGRVTHAAKVLQFEPLVEGSGFEPTFNLTLTEAQRLMDELWMCGLRPSEGTGSAGALAATERHLQDSRAYVEKLLAKVLK